MPGGPESSVSPQAHDALIRPARCAGAQVGLGCGPGRAPARPAGVAELDRRIIAVLDEFVETDDQRLDQPALGGILVLHRLAG